MVLQAAMVSTWSATVQGADPNDLPAQRWAVVAPQGERRPHARRDRRAHRAPPAQQGAAPTDLPRPPGMDAAAAIRWRDEVLRDEDVPRTSARATS
jgi:hypothetical protein